MIAGVAAECLIETSRMEIWPYRENDERRVEHVQDYFVLANFARRLNLPMFAERAGDEETARDARRRSASPRRRGGDARLIGLRPVEPVRRSTPGPRRRGRSEPANVYSPVEVATMQIRLSRRLEEAERTVRSLTVDGFLARFHEVPRDLRDEPLLAEFVHAFASQLAVAVKPSPCVARAGGGDMEHHFYTALVNDLAIYGLGLARRERTLQRLYALTEKYRGQPATFACTLVPRKTPGAPRAGCG